MENMTARVIGRLRKYFTEYCRCTSIHGFRYFGEKRTFFERGWWFMVFVLCLSGCAYFISLVYMKWENSPVIVSFSTKETPIYQIPFPAVTICPETKAIKQIYSHSEMVRKLDNNESLTMREYQQVSYMNLLCDFDITEPMLREYERSDINSTFDNYYYEKNEFFDFLYNVTPPLLFIKCKWMNMDFECGDHFQIILTDEGICYTFNMLNLTDIYKDNVLIPNIPFYDYPNISGNVTWTLDDGYADHEDVETYPQRSLFSGAKNALDLYLGEMSENIDHSCKLSIQGFKVSLHTPMRIPRPSQQYYRVPLNEVVLTEIQPVMITTSKAVKDFNPQKRECYFQNEKPLKFFRRYSQRNCNLECLTNFTFYWCECVNFFMPRENGTDICGSLNKECMDEAEKILQQGHLSKILSKRRKRKNLTESYLEEINMVPDCTCLPLCTDLSYNAETSSTRWNWKNMYKVLNDSSLIIEEDMSVSRLIIYFKDSQFVTSKRHELYGPTDFLGNFGGLLGLFTGFSILSLMEIIYFLTVRIFCNIRLYGSWSGNEN